MKPVILFLSVVGLFLSVAAFAGGHGCAPGHCSVHAGGYSSHSHHDTDAFADIRTKICTGYLVYGRDTMRGIIVCAGNAVCLRANEEQDSTYAFCIADTNLTDVLLQENNRTIHLTRLENGKLYRVFHTGKLSVYDTYFSFDRQSKKFFDEDSWVRYEGHSEALTNFWTTSVKRKLIGKVNKVYGLALAPGDYKKTKLLAYIDQLD